MNQILDFGDGNNNNNDKKSKKPVKEKKLNKKDNAFNNNYNENNNFNGGINYSSNKTKMSISDKIVKVFAILMIVLAIALIFSGATSIMKNKKDVNAQKNNTNVKPKVEAEILAVLNEEEGKVKITVNSSVTILKMIYSWDQDHDNVVSGEKQTTLEEEVIVPYGEHVLHVQVIDEQNNKTIKDFSFDSEMGVDTTRPDITLVVTEDKKLSITATDDTSIAYVTYTWNEEETITMTPEEEGLTEFSFEIEIPRGKNTIVVNAVDGSDLSNSRVTTKTLEGVVKPKVECTLSADSKVLTIKCSHDSGIKKIYYTFQGMPYQWELEEGAVAPTELSFTQNSVEGNNLMTITVTGVDDATTEFNPEWEGPAVQEPVNLIENN